MLDYDWLRWLRAKARQQRSSKQISQHDASATRAAAAAGAAACVRTFAFIIIAARAGCWLAAIGSERGQTARADAAPFPFRAAHPRQIYHSHATHAMPTHTRHMSSCLSEMGTQFIAAFVGGVNEVHAQRKMCSRRR